MDLKTYDRKKLWGLAAAKCSICKDDLFLKEELDTNIGEECHISSHKPDFPNATFSRYIENLKKDERDKSYDNAILLCNKHHKVIDNPKSTQYTIEKLHQIKSEHEVWVLEKLKEDTDESYKLRKRIEEAVQKIWIYKKEFMLNRIRFQWIKNKLVEIDDDKFQELLLPIFNSSTTKYLEESTEEFGNNGLVSCPYCYENLIYDKASDSMYCRKCDKYIE